MNRACHGMLLLMVLVAHSASAHEFWLQPAEFWWSSSQSMPLSLLVGHGAESERSKIPSRRIARMEAIGPGASIDLRPTLSGGGTQLRFDAPGAYVIALATDNQARSDLPASRFNDYLRAEGLTPALKAREATGRTNAEGSERYSRHAKTIVQVGTPEQQSHVTRPHGLRLEIVPEISPYLQPAPAQLPVRVIFEDKPLAGARVRMSVLGLDFRTVASQVTDKNGRAVFDMPSQGRWLLQVAWTEPLPVEDEADFDTVFASLTFGFPS